MCALGLGLSWQYGNWLASLCNRVYNSFLFVCCLYISCVRELHSLFVRCLLKIFFLKSYWIYYLKCTLRLEIDNNREKERSTNVTWKRYTLVVIETHKKNENLVNSFLQWKLENYYLNVDLEYDGKSKFSLRIFIFCSFSFLHSFFL